MIIRKRKKLPQLFIQDKFFQNIHSTLQITAPVNDDFVPCFCLFLYTLAVVESSRIKFHQAASLLPSGRSLPGNRACQAE
jgi:hypothetical protein